jgi:Ca2+-binding EF-hand superfamily protein
MGALCGRVEFVPNEKIVGQDNESHDIIKKLKFSPSEINQLFRAFKKCDADDSNNIQLMELFH